MELLVMKGIIKKLVPHQNNSLNKRDVDTTKMNFYQWIVYSLEVHKALCNTVLWNIMS